MANTQQSWSAVLSELDKYGDRVVMQAPPREPLHGVAHEEPAEWDDAEQTAAVREQDDGRCPANRLASTVRTLLATHNRPLSKRAWGHYGGKRLKVTAVVQASQTGQPVPDDVPADAPVLVLAHKQYKHVSRVFRQVNRQTALLERLTGNR